MNDTIITVAVVLLLVGIFGMVLLFENRSQKQMFLMRLRRNWGTIPEREYTYEELDRISHYARRKGAGSFMIDDTTWNDLDMDQVFMMLNQTVSGCGEDYLYYLLRKPLFDQEALSRRDKLVEYFRSHREQREAVQMILREIGRPANMSVSDYIFALKDVEQRSPFGYILQMIAVFAGIACAVTIPVFGIFLLLGVIAWNVVTHVRAMEKVEPYLRCFVCLLQLAAAGEKLGRLKLDALQDYAQPLVKSAKAMDKIRRKSKVVVQKNGVGEGLEGLILTYINLVFLLDLIQFYSMVRLFGGMEKDADTLMENIGILDSAIAIASYREYLAYYCLPEFVPGNQASMEVKELYHPLIAEPVANSISVSGGVLITGSNASGKSTFLKNVAINAIFAQTIYTCTAQSYRANMMKVLTSMALRDNLQGGESYYIVEIKSLKRILEESRKKEPMLCIVDEVLRGTNTIERIAASSRILRFLDCPWVISFAATHDIELSYILEGIYKNYHFEEKILENDVVFDYLLRGGRATSRNAIALLEMIGYDREIVEEARNAAAVFEKSGVWERIRTGREEIQKGQGEGAC